jgi:PAS domain S-box-containing protein
MSSKPTYEELERRIRELEKHAAEPKGAEEAPLLSEEKLITFMNSMTDFFVVTDKSEKLIYVNKSMSKKLGYSEEEMIGMHISRIISEESMVNFVAEVKELVEKGELNIEATWLTKDGKKIHGEISANAIYDSDGNYTGSRGVFRNITERKRAEEALQEARDQLERRVEERTAQLVKANEKLKDEIEERKLAEEGLRESEKHYRETVDAMKDWILVVDTDLRIVQFNEAFMQVSKELGLTTDVIGRTPMEIFPFLPDTVLDEYRWVFENKAVLITQETTKVAGREFITESRKIPLLENGRIVRVVSVIRDITESKHLESQLQQSQKLEAIGTLAGGIAHDFNNLIMGIQGNVSLMLYDKDDRHPDYERLRSIEKQVQSGARLTSHLLGYARGGRYEIKPVDLNQLVEETVQTFGRTKKAITIHRELAEGLFAIEADPGQIEQVLWNIYVNAADAMPRGGDLFLKTMSVAHEDIKGKLYEPKPGNYVLLIVTDTGMGMDRKTMERIFDPFFTTKEMGRGTGLGLASAYGILKAHGGYVDVDSKKGEGSTFNIYLPASEKRVQETVDTTERSMEGTGTVLLVDDEEVILKVGQDLLETMGYQVLLARDGKEAVEVYKKNYDIVDIVVLDMVMPTMGGGDAYDRIKELNQNIKVLLSSGFSIDGEATEILDRGCNGFIQKPFTMQALSRKIGDILGEE